MSLNVQPITRAVHNRFKNDFDCGNNRLNAFFRGPEALDSGIGVTYVFLSDNESELLGYYNITTGVISVANDSCYRIGGSVHINCFALDNKYHGILQDYDDNGNEIKMSDIFFRDCIEKIISLRNRIGFTFITLSSTQEGYHLYKRAQFDELDEDMFISEKDMEKGGCIPMYYSLDTEEF